MNKLYKIRDKFKLGNESRIKKQINKNEKNNISLFNKSTVEKNPKIIGISGSKGKSTVAYLIHNYLKDAGYKSILYSSVGIDSPASFNIVNEEVENPILDTQMIYDMVEEAIEYDTDYIILEVNERAIEKGFTKEIPFDIRLLTNINKTHNTYFYSNYEEVKKRFFLEADFEATLIFNASTKEMFEELYAINDNKKVTYMSNYVVDIKNIDREKVNYILTSDEERMDDLKGLKFDVNGHYFESNMLYPHNAINIMGVISVLEELGVYDYEKFKEFIKEVNVPGRDEVIKVNDRTIIINTAISPHLEILEGYKKRGNIREISLLTGSVGAGYVHWENEFGEEKMLSEREKAIEFAYNYLKKYVDNVYITTNDSGSTNKEQLIEYQASFIDNDINIYKDIDRTNAIKQILADSKKGDLIYISGRGNRRIMCDSENTFVFHKDQEVILKIIDEIGWK